MYSFASWVRYKQTLVSLNRVTEAIVRSHSSNVINKLAWSQHVLVRVLLPLVGSCSSSCHAVMCSKLLHQRDFLLYPKVVLSPINFLKIYSTQTK